MDLLQKPIPLDVQLSAACALNFHAWRELLAPFGFQWNPENSSVEYRDYRNLFTFSEHDLLTYLADHPEICRQVLHDSYDKRSTPSTFIEEWGLKYRVGWYEHGEHEVQVFDEITEAVADYVLYSLGFPRHHALHNQ